MQGLSLRWRRPAFLWASESESECVMTDEFERGIFHRLQRARASQSRPVSHTRGRARQYVRPLRCQQKWPRTSSTEHCTAGRGLAGGTRSSISLSCRFYYCTVPRAGTGHSDGNSKAQAGGEREEETARHCSCLVLLHSSIYNGPIYTCRHVCGRTDRITCAGPACYAVPMLTASPRE